MSYSLNPKVRGSLCKQSYLLTRAVGRGRAFSALMAACMLLFGRTPRHRIY
jgi:hypothetical protein